MEALNLEYIRIAVALIGVGAAAYQDYKTSFIDEKIIYLMLLVALVLNFLPFITENSYLIVYALIVSIVILALGYVFYRKGQLGMGDVLLFVAIQQLLPLAPLSLRFLNPISFGLDFSALSEFSGDNWFLIGYLNVFKHFLFLLTIFLASSFLATIGSSMQYAIALVESKKRLKPNMLVGTASIIGLFLGAVFLYFYFGVSIASAMFMLLFLSSAFFLTFRQQILDEIVIQRIPIPKIEDEDILAMEKMPPEIVRKYGLERVLTQKQVKKLSEIQKKEGMKLFPISKVLPRFGPYIFIALVIGILFGNILEIIGLLSMRF
ncbi:MAG: prepilin peptidase [Candidatus Micrarchaeota archaeon]